jgi:hypothetical protein
MLGMGWLVQALPHQAFSFNMVFGIGGFWDVSLVALMTLFGQLIASTSAQILWEAPSGLLAWFGVAAGLWLSRLFIALPARPRRIVPVFLSAEAAMLLVSALGAVWTVLLSIWVAGQLNVWLLLVVMVGIQDFRYADPPRSRTAFCWLWAVTRHIPISKWWWRPFRTATKGVDPHERHRRLGARDVSDRTHGLRALVKLRHWLTCGKAFAVMLVTQTGLR